MTRILRKRARLSYVEYTEKDIYLPPLKSTKTDGGRQVAQKSQMAVFPDERYTLYYDLSNKIKTSLNGHRKDSPVVCIKMPFDKNEYASGLQICGSKKRVVRGVDHFTITKYQDLDKLLGKNWHFRGINVNGDFCFVILSTVEFYIYRRRNLKEYIPLLSGSGKVTVKEKCRKQGYMLSFSFVKDNGTCEKFGLDKKIF